MSDAELLAGRRLIRRDWGVMAALFALCLLTRVPLWSPLITHPDGAETAWGLEKFDLAAEHPHPPGYLLFWATGKAFFLLGLSAETSLALAVTLYAALTVALLYALGTLMFGARAGLAAAVLLLFENNFWRVSLTHISAITAAFCGVLVALAAFRAWQEPRSRWALVGAVLLGLAAGYRQDLLGFLGLLWLWCAWRSGWKQVLGGLVIVGLLTALWTALAAWATGGYGLFRSLNQLQWQEAIFPASALYAWGEGPRAAADALIHNLGNWFGLVFGEGSHLSVLGWLVLAV